MTKLKVPNVPVQEIPNKSTAAVASARKDAIISKMNKLEKKIVGEIHIEGVVCPSKEEGLKHLYEFGQRKDMSRYNYAFLMEEEDGTLKLVERLDMPCWGAIREYECGSRPDDPWPSDLRAPRHIFPKTGNPIAIVFQFNWLEGIYKDSWNRFCTEFTFNMEVSPWVSILKDFELVVRDDGTISGVLFKDTKIDPTVMANMMKYAGRTNYTNQYLSFVDQGHHPLTVWGYLIRHNPGRIIPEWLFNRTPPDLSNGKTFYERESYNRPDVEKLWGGKDNAGVLTANMTIEQIDQLRLSVMENNNGQDASAA